MEVPCSGPLSYPFPNSRSGLARVESVSLFQVPLFSVLLLLFFVWTSEFLILDVTSPSLLQGDVLHSEIQDTRRCRRTEGREEWVSLST